MANHRSYYHIADFRPFLKHPEKYVNVGNKNLTARSGLEMRSFLKLDSLASVIKWSSENVVIPYQKPIFLNESDSTVIGTDEHKYYIDLWVQWQSAGGLVEMLVEIKPKSMCYPPKMPVNNNRKSWLNYHSSMKQFLINKYKWIESVNLCRRISASGSGRDIRFVIMTEDEILSGEKICGI